MGSATVPSRAALRWRRRTPPRNARRRRAGITDEQAAEIERQATLNVGMFETVFEGYFSHQ